MVDRGNVDKYRKSYSGGVKAQNEGVWGRDTARERYGALKQPDTTATDRSQPQAPENKRGPDYTNRTPNSWLRGYGTSDRESAEGKPNFHPGYKGKR
jgi:hypothetical protein